MTRLENKVAWVTGGGRGIGRAIALAFAADGASVAVSSRTIEELRSVADEIRELGCKAFAVRADALSFEDTRECVEAIEGDLGHIDILLNNAGGGTSVDPDGLSPEALDDQTFIANLSLNLVSAYRASKAVLPSMLERRFGRIINIGSGYAKRSGGAPAYSAAKHGLIGLTRAMAAEVARQGVTVNCLCPGWTNTQLVNLDAMAQYQKVDVSIVRGRIESENLQNRILEPEELGPMAALLASGDAAGITGQVISVDGGYKV